MAGSAGGCKQSLAQPSADRFVVKREAGVRDADRNSCEQECWKDSPVTRHNPTRIDVDQGIVCDVERIGPISEEPRYPTSNASIFPFLFPSSQEVPSNCCMTTGSRTVYVLGLRKYHVWSSFVKGSEEFIRCVVLEHHMIESRKSGDLKWGSGLDFIYSD
jgi:hypothetical protein